MQQLRSLVNGYKIAQILMSAEQLGIFAAISHGSNTLDAIANRIGGNTATIEPVLRALQNVGILKEELGVFLFTEYGSLLDPQVQGSQNGYLQYAASVKSLWNDLDLAIKDPHRSTENFAAITGQNVETSRRFMAAMDANAKPQAKWIAEKFDFSGRSILDVGAGAGTYSFSVAQKFTTSKIVAFDLPAIAEPLTKRLKSTELIDRVQVLSGDYHTDIPNEKFDDMFLFAVIHQESPERAQDLLSKAKSGLKPSGRLFLTSFFVDETRSKPDFAVIFGVEMLVMVPGGRVYSFIEVENLMRRAGFTNIQKYDDIPGPATLYVSS